MRRERRRRRRTLLIQCTQPFQWERALLTRVFCRLLFPAPLQALARPDAAAGAPWRCVCVCVRVCVCGSVCP